VGGGGCLELFPFLLAVNYIVFAVLFPCILLSCAQRATGVKGVFFFLVFYLRGGAGDRLVCHTISFSIVFSVFLFFLSLFSFG